MQISQQKTKIIIAPLQTPCGRLFLGSYGDCLCLCDWETDGHRAHVDRRLMRMLRSRFVEGHSAVIETAMDQLEQYFAGNRQMFDVPLLPVGTEFQQRVWHELQHISYGTTASYAEIASRVGRPQAVRAVANATGSNSMSIFIPCHRVVGSDGRLTGYAGGLTAKQILLNLERAHSETYSSKSPL